MIRHRLILSVAASLAVSAVECQAALITYVDATHGAAGNTTLADGSVFTPAVPRTNSDNAWSERAFANGGTIYVTNEGEPPGEDAPGLATTITGLVPSQNYDVFAYFWDGNGNWRLKASLFQLPPLPNDPAVSFSATGSATSTAAPLAVPADFVVAPLVAEGDRLMHQASLRRFRADSNGEIVVYIDDLENPTSGGGTIRTWYDGVGYAAVPEPATLCIGAMLSLAFRNRPRRKGTGTFCSEDCAK